MMHVTEDVKLAAERYNQHQANCPQCSSTDPKLMCEDGARALQLFLDAVLAAPEE